MRHKITKAITAFFFLSIFPVASINQRANAVATEPVVTAPSVVDFSGQIWAAGQFGISGYSVDAPASMTLLVSIYLSDAPTGDSLTVSTHSNLTLSYGFAAGAWTGFTEISFTGSKADVNNALASTNFKYISATGAKNSTAKIRVLATESVPGVAYFAKDDHFYKVGHFMSVTGATPAANQTSYVICNSAGASGYIDAYSAIESLTAISTGSSNCSWAEANRLARLTTLKGRPGYLANITSQSENDFLKDKLSGALNIWIGGTDGGYNGAPDTGVATSLTSTPFDYMSNDTLTAYSGGTEGLWHFYDGPEAGKIFWRYTGTYHCGLIGTFGYTIGHVDTQAKWLTFQNQCAIRGYNITLNSSNASGETEASNYQAVGYSNWASYEPNNSSSAPARGEFNIVFNWNSSNGQWNDLLSSESTVTFYGYLIEYGDSTAFTGVSKSQISVGYPINAVLNPQNGSDTSTVAVSIGGQLSTPSTPTRSGYSFAGWFTSASGGSALTFPYTHGQSANFNLYAQWIADLNVTYNSQGGSAISSATTASSGSISTSPGTPTRSGYTFAGWFTASSGGSAITFPYSHGQTSDFTLYAQWNLVPVPAPVVAVGPPPPSKVQPPVTISVPKTEIEFGQTLKLELAGGVSGSGTTYSVSGSGLCTINGSGVLTALKEGTCTVTATKLSSGDYKSAESNSITITVKPLQAIENFGTVQPVPTGSTVIVIPKDNTTPVAVSTPKGSTSTTTKTTTADRKVEVSQTPSKTVIQISPNQIQLSPKSGANNSDILLSGLVKGLKIKATVTMLDGKTKTSTPATPNELNKLINSNPNAKVNIEITPTINQDAKKSAQIAVDGAKKNQRVKVTIK